MTGQQNGFIRVKQTVLATSVPENHRPSAIAEVGQKWIDSMVRQAQPCQNRLRLMLAPGIRLQRKR